ncbi:MAG: hypothetical protein KKE20_04675 [Nanoarchaeota archaeon]|nr:hypothetical protein [Nanoarchaeota archaeon]
MREEFEIRIDKETRIKVWKRDSRFSMTYLFYIDKWIDIARIDNCLHEGRIGTHIHRYRESRVEFREMTIKESMDTLKNIGKNIKEKIKDGCYRDC